MIQFLDNLLHIVVLIYFVAFLISVILTGIEAILD